MKSLSTLAASLLWASTALAQGTQVQQDPAPPTIVGQVTPGSPSVSFDEAVGDSGYLTGNRAFPNFIGFLSNPLESIDPRAVTALWPMFGNTHISNEAAIPNGSFQLYGAGLYVALSDRLMIGLNQGGYATADFDRNDRRTFLDRRGRLRERREFGGEREGWLNLGGFAQYTLIADVPNQFILSAGMRWEAPSGSSAIFQGRGPAHLAPYVNFGKEYGKFHVLGTVGFEFPAGGGSTTTNYFYANAHLDRQMFGWLYPLVEVNWTYHTTNVDIDLPSRGGDFISLGNFTATGNLVTLAVGANAVLVPSKLEIGAVYMTPLATQRHFDFNGLLVKMVIRY